MDLLALVDIAELLGEPKRAIDDACDRFAAFIPTVEIGGQRWYYSEALDVLRVITDQRKDAVDDVAIEAYLTRHFLLATDPDEPVEPPAPAAAPAASNQLDPAMLATIVSQAVAATLTQQHSQAQPPSAPQVVPADPPTRRPADQVEPFDHAALSTLIAQAVTTALAPQSAMIYDELQHLRRELAHSLAVEETPTPERAHDEPATALIDSVELDALHDALSDLQDAVADLRVDLRRLQDRIDSSPSLPLDSATPNGAAHRPPAESTPAPSNGATPHTPEDDEPAPGFLKRFTAHTPRRMGRNLLEE